MDLCNPLKLRNLRGFFILIVTLCFSLLLFIVVIGLTTSAEEFQNTFDHEKGHLAMHISSALKIKPYGEEYQYLTGEIGQSMFKIAKRFLCDDCRQKLVIEIKEIDKKD